MKTWKICGINFDHMHMGDLLRLVHEHPNAEIAGVCDENIERMEGVGTKFDIPQDRVFTDYRDCLESSKPDIVILCPSTGRHADYVEYVAPYGVNVLVEKPFAGSLAEADRMIAAMERSGKTMVINWPLAWYPCHVTTKRLIGDGIIGDVLEVHYYDGNRGPLRHISDKVEISAEEAAREKSRSWWYKRSEGGGSLQDYLGYGVTLGTWFQNGRAPIEVTCVVDETPGLEVDEHSITIARYAHGLSKFETRWGTFSDPWTHQPQPKCGFVVVGRRGTITSYDYEDTIRVQTEECPEGRAVPVDKLAEPNRNPIEHLIHSLETGEQVIGPLTPTLCRIGQQIIETAAQSAREKRTLRLIT
jgi:glucose-fructose oxidoreductase